MKAEHRQLLLAAQCVAGPSRGVIRVLEDDACLPEVMR